MTLALRTRAVLVFATVASLDTFYTGQVRAGQGMAQLDPATRALFDRASALADQKRFAEACPDFEEVVRRVPTGVGAMIALAECREGEGKLATAWTVWSEAEAAAGLNNDKAREKQAKAGEAGLEPRLSRLTITVASEIAALPGLVIHHDKLTMTRSEWGLALPVNGGTHVVTATATGKRPWQKDVVIREEGDKVSVVIPVLEDAPAEPSLPAPVPPVVPTPRPAAPLAVTTSAVNVNAGAGNVATPPRVASSNPGVPGWAWAAGTAGVALVGGAVGFHFDQSAAATTIDTKCPLPGRAGCRSGYDFTSDRARELRDFDLFLGLGIGGVMALGASVVGIVIGTTSKPVSAPVAWAILPATLPGHGAGAAFAARW